MIYQENVADNRMKGMTYATLTAPLTRPAFDSAFTEFPPLGWPTRHPARFSGSRFSDRITYLLSRSASTTFGGARLTTLRLVTPALTKTKLPADSESLV